MSLFTPRRTHQQHRMSFTGVRKELNVTQPSTPRKHPQSPRFSKTFSGSFNKSPVRMTSIVPPECRSPEIVRKEYCNLLTPFEVFELSEYKQIYYLGRLYQKVRPNEALTHNSGFDDKCDNLIVKVDDHIAYQYKVMSILDHDDNAITTLCYDFAFKENFIVKIFANTDEMRKQAELVILSLEKARVNNAGHIIRCFSSFTFRNHKCLVLEVLGSDVTSIIKNEPDSSTKSFIRAAAISLFSAVNECHKCGIVHRKVNLRNLLVDPKKRGSFKLGDFDNCIFEGNGLKASKRLIEKAPEEIFDRESPKEAIDIWNCGLCLYYLATGTHIFKGRTVNEVYESFVSICEEPPEGFEEECPKFYLSKKEKDETNEEEEQEKVIPRRYLLQILCDNELSDLITKCLQWRGEDRITAEEALLHPFIQQTKLPPLIPTPP